MEERLCELHSLEFGTSQLRPGESLRIGRHRDNAIVVDDEMVSRFHARITWDAKLEYPVVFDNGSQNGTAVDGVRVRTATPLTNDARLVVGPHVFTVKLTGCDERPAVLKDTGELVALFSEAGPELRGNLGEDFTLLQLLLDLESKQRSGTLRLRSDDGKAKLTWCLGRIMQIELSEQGSQPCSGLRAMERTLGMKAGSFSFTRDMEPTDDPINLWLSDYVRTRKVTKPYDTTKIKRPSGLWKRFGSNEGEKG